MFVQALFLIPVDERLRLRVVNHKALFNGFLVVVGTSAFLSALDETLHQFVFGHVQFNHGSHFMSTLGKHLLQCLGLWDGTGESVEDNTFVRCSKPVVHAGQNADHQVVGNQLSVVYQSFGSHSQFCTFLDFIAKNITC